mmetsp:Transcript_61538/g.74011  ORF Transcript_61538/g.74011 Transcript_61538/m.74011 type:complete len:294 (+) Transcript_61538:79-960(+)
MWDAKIENEKMSSQELELFREIDMAGNHYSESVDLFHMTKVIIQRHMRHQHNHYMHEMNEMRKRSLLLKKKLDEWTQRYDELYEDFVLAEKTKNDQAILDEFRSSRRSSQFGRNSAYIQNVRQKGSNRLDYETDKLRGVFDLRKHEKTTSEVKESPPLKKVAQTSDTSPQSIAKKVSFSPPETKCEEPENQQLSSPFVNIIPSSNEKKNQTCYPMKPSPRRRSSSFTTTIPTISEEKTYINDSKSNSTVPTSLTLGTSISTSITSDSRSRKKKKSRGKISWRRPPGRHPECTK